jgi:hypothetical protein
MIDLYENGFKPKEESTHKYIHLQSRMLNHAVYNIAEKKVKWGKSD